MVTMRRMRYLRHKYNISIAELARFSPVSPQRLTQIELEQENISRANERLVASAFEAYIENARNSLSALEDEFRVYKKCLLDLVDERGQDV